jgi:hypothetical protein
MILAYCQELLADSAFCFCLCSQFWIEPAAPTKMWDAFRWTSGAQVKYLSDFAFSIGRRYEELVPDAGMVSPEKDRNVLAYDGWAYCARTQDREIFLAYFEKDAARPQIRGAKLNASYHAQWFNPRAGSWLDVGSGVLKSSPTGTIDLPEFPGDTDWGLKLATQ